MVAYTVGAAVHLQELLIGIHPLSSSWCAVASSAVSPLLCFVAPKAFVPVNASAPRGLHSGLRGFLATGLLLPQWTDVQALPRLVQRGLMNIVGIMLFVGASHSCATLHPS